MRACEWIFVYIRKHFLFAYLLSFTSIGVCPFSTAIDLKDLQARWLEKEKYVCCVRACVSVYFPKPLSKSLKAAHFVNIWISIVNKIACKYSFILSLLTLDCLCTRKSISDINLVRRLTKDVRGRRKKHENRQRKNNPSQERFSLCFRLSWDLHIGIYLCRIYIFETKKNVLSLFRSPF